MALYPLDRPAESTQVLRYRGTISVSGSTAATYPKASAVVDSDAAVVGNVFTAWVRFPLFRLGQTASEKRLPLNVYDDESPAGIAPHAPVACVASASPGVNTSDQSMDAQTWAQNLEIWFNNIDTNVLLCDHAVSVDNNPANGAIVMLDNATTSGVGSGTGLPVVAVRFVVTANDGVIRAFNVDLTFEIRHSNHR